jgi:hypothetical protein
MNDHIVGKRIRDLNSGRLATVTGSYEAEEPGEKPGYYYQYDGELSTHWVSCTAMPIRFATVKTIATADKSPRELREER